MDIDALFKFYYRPLCLYALHYLKGGIDQAEDIVQDCFVRMWEHQPRNPKAFLYAAVRNACIDRLRKANPFLTDVEPADLAGTISDEEAQERSVDEAELWTAIDSLPTRCREIFLMSKRDGMRYREIAEELGLSEKTVEHQIAKALSRLRGMRGDLLFTLFFM